MGMETLSNFSVEILEEPFDYQVVTKQNFPKYAKEYLHQYLQQKKIIKIFI